MPLSASTTWRGAFPTGISSGTVSLAVSITPSLLAPLSATYSFDPSGESAIPDGSSAPFATSAASALFSLNSPASS